MEEGSGFFSGGPLQGGSLPRRPHPHCTRSVSSWVAPLHSINLREHRNASRWQTQQVSNHGLQPRQLCTTWGYSKMFAWESDGLLTDSALLLVAALWVSSPTTFSLRLRIQNGDNKSITLQGLSSGPNAKPHTTLLAHTWHSKCSTAKYCDNRFLSFSYKARCSLPIIRISSSYLNSRSFRFNFVYPTDYIVKVISDPCVIQMRPITSISSSLAFCTFWNYSSLYFLDKLLDFCLGFSSVCIFHLPKVQHKHWLIIQVQKK